MKSFKAALLIFIICFVFGCATSKEFQMSEEYFNKQDYQQSLKYVEMALAQKPNNEKYLKHKEKIQDMNYTRLRAEYDLTPKGEIAERREKLKELIRLGEELKYASAKNYKSELESIPSEAQLESNINKFNKFFLNDRFQDALKELAGLKKYVSNKKVAESFATLTPPHTNAIALSKYCEDLAQNKNYKALIGIIEQLDALLDNDNSNFLDNLKDSVATQIRNRGDVFLENNKPATALAFYDVATRFKPSSIESNTKAEIKKQVDAYFKEHLHIKIEAAIEQGNKEHFIELILNKIKSAYNTMSSLTNAKSISSSKIAVLVSLERSENNIEPSKPTYKYSKYISGYRQVLNSIYYAAKSKVDQANIELYRLNNQPVYNDAQAVIRVLAVLGWQKILNDNQQILQSNAIYDNVPIYIDYQYSQTDITINKLVQLSYKIYDIERKALLKEDSFIKKTSETINILEGVHPEDAYNKKNSDNFNYTEQAGKFDAFVDNTFIKLAEKIVDEMPILYSKRADDYMSISEPADALENYLIGNLLKLSINKDAIEPIPDELSVKMYVLSPKSDLHRKLSMRKNPLIEKEAVTPNNNVVGTSTKDKAIQETRFSESDIPQLVKSTANKVVLVKAITNNGISQGSGFLVSEKGHIITNLHVVKNSSAIIVKLSDDTEYSSRILMSDSLSDLALLKIQIENAPYFSLNPSHMCEVGETIILIGAPHGFEQTVSKGIISGKRTMTKLSMIQTDAQMTHGNSGGPMINLFGEVIGVNSQTLNVIDPGAPGPLNFAIAIEEVVKRFSSQLKKW